MHSQTTTHMLLLTSEELESLLVAFTGTVSTDIGLCAYVLYTFMCVCMCIHIFVHNLYMHIYTPAHTHGFTDKHESALLSSRDQQPIC